MWPDDAESVQQIEDDWVGENGDKRCRTVTRLCSVILLTVLASVLKSISGHLHVLSLICCNAGPTPINDYALTLFTDSVCVLSFIAVGLALYWIRSAIKHAL